jgi:hypothetical protein
VSGNGGGGGGSGEGTVSGGDGAVGKIILNYSRTDPIVVMPPGRPA